MPYSAHWTWKWGLWCKFWDIWQKYFLNFSFKKHGWFYSDLYNLRRLFSKNWLLKSKRFFLFLFQIFLTHKKNRISRNKDTLKTVQTYWINKNWRFWTFSAKNPSITKIVPSISRFFVPCCFDSIVLIKFADILQL